MLNVCPLFNKSAVFALIAVVSLFPGDCISAQSCWDGIFQLGYDPVTQQANENLALQRIGKIYELSARVSDHLEIDSELLMICI